MAKATLCTWVTQTYRVLQDFALFIMIFHCIYHQIVNQNNQTFKKRKDYFLWKSKITIKVFWPIRQSNDKNAFRIWNIIANLTVWVYIIIILMSYSYKIACKEWISLEFSIFQSQNNQYYQSNFSYVIFVWKGNTLVTRSEFSNINYTKNDSVKIKY